MSQLNLARAAQLIGVTFVGALPASGVTMVFCGLKKQVLDVIQNTGLAELIGRQYFIPSEDQALAAIYGWLEPEGKGELLPRSADAAAASGEPRG